MIERAGIGKWAMADHSMNGAQEELGHLGEVTVLDDLEGDGAQEGLG